MNWVDDDEEIVDVSSMQEALAGTPVLMPVPWNGFRPVARPAKDWRVAPPGKRCCWTGGVGRQHCQQPAVAELNRKVRLRRDGLPSDRWWAYCEKHTHGYSRWVVGDRVLEWHMVPEGEETS